MSKLQAIELANFMSIENARLEFDGEAIVNITGYNDSGKSAITRALEVILYDAYTNEQVRFIKDGKDSFGVGLEFDDGVSINKYKYANGKSVWEMLKGDEVIFTNRLKDGVAAMGKIPDPIEKYLGVIKDEETDEKLNVRRNIDKLFLINTSGSENYKILNTVLRYDILSESVKKLNEDRNKLQSEFASNVTSRDTLKNEVNGLQVLEDSVINSLTNLKENLTSNKDKALYLSSIKENKQILDELVVHDELPYIDTTRISMIEELKTLNENRDIVIPAECNYIDISRLEELGRIMEASKDLDISIPPEVPYLDASKIEGVKAVGLAYNDLYQISDELTGIETEREHTLNQLRELSQLHGFKICKSCGTVVE